MQGMPVYNILFYTTSLILYSQRPHSIIYPADLQGKLMSWDIESPINRRSASEPRWISIYQLQAAMNSKQEEVSECTKFTSSAGRCTKVSFILITLRSFQSLQSETYVYWRCLVLETLKQARWRALIGTTMTFLWKSQVRLEATMFWPVEDPRIFSAVPWTLLEHVMQNLGSQCIRCYMIVGGSSIVQCEMCGVIIAVRASAKYLMYVGAEKYLRAEKRHRGHKVVATLNQWWSHTFIG